MLPLVASGSLGFALVLVYLSYRAGDPVGAVRAAPQVALWVEGMTEPLACAGSPHRVHWNAEAKFRCWACSSPEKLAWAPEDEAEARTLISEGWRQVSSKHLTVARCTLPPMEQMVRFSGSCPDWLREEVERTVESHITRYGLRVGGEGIEKRELSVAVFRAFKHLGGLVA